MSNWKVYKDAQFPNDKVLLGFKGKAILDTGYVGAPYIVLDPDRVNPGDLALMIADFLKGNGYVVENINHYLHISLDGVKICVMSSDDYMLRVRRYDQNDATFFNSADPTFEPKSLITKLNMWFVELREEKSKPPKIVPL